jgi:hypothetical protein
MQKSTIPNPSSLPFNITDEILKMLKINIQIWGENIYVILKRVCLSNTCTIDYLILSVLLS